MDTGVLIDARTFLGNVWKLQRPVLALGGEGAGAGRCSRPSSP